MDKNKIIEIVKDPSVKSNKDLNDGLDFLDKEFEKTKESIVLLTRYLDKVELAYKQINDEVNKRVINV